MRFLKRRFLFSSLIGVNIYRRTSIMMRIMLI